MTKLSVEIIVEAEDETTAKDFIMNCMLGAQVCRMARLRNIVWDIATIKRSSGDDIKDW